MGQSVSRYTQRYFVPNIFSGMSYQRGASGQPPGYPGAPGPAAGPPRPYGGPQSGYPGPPRQPPYNGPPGVGQGPQMVSLSQRGQSAGPIGPPGGSKRPAGPSQHQQTKPAKKKKKL